MELRFLCHNRHMLPCAFLFRFYKTFTIFLRVAPASCERWRTNSYNTIYTCLFTTIRWEPFPVPPSGLFPEIELCNVSKDAEKSVFYDSTTKFNTFD